MPDALWEGAAAPVPGLGQPAVPVQDLSADKILLAAPRVAWEGRTLPALGGIPLLAKLGQGGMGAVYYGVHPRLYLEVAVKVLPFLLAEQAPELVTRFFREARIAAQVKSPHLVGVLDVNEDHGLYYLVMEYVSGASAAAYLRELKAAGQQGLPEAVAFEICLAAGRGLAAAHAKGIVHRDVKPENILVPKAPQGGWLFAESKLADLGLARGDWQGQSLTETRAHMGTPGYMAPEQAQDAKSAQAPADIFGLGASLYALLAGQAPFTGSSAFQVLNDTVHKPHRPLRELRPDLSPTAAAIVDRCLSKEPAQRYPDGAELALALQNARASLPEPGPTLTPWRDPKLQPTPAPLPILPPASTTLPVAAAVPLPQPAAAPLPSPPSPVPAQPRPAATPIEPTPYPVGSGGAPTAVTRSADAPRARRGGRYVLVAGALLVLAILTIFAFAAFQRWPAGLKPDAGSLGPSQPGLPRVATGRGEKPDQPVPPVQGVPANPPEPSGQPVPPVQGVPANQPEPSGQPVLPVQGVSANQPEPSGQPVPPVQGVSANQPEPSGQPVPPAQPVPANQPVPPGQTVAPAPSAPVRPGPPVQSVPAGQPVPPEASQPLQSAPPTQASLAGPPLPSAQPVPAVQPAEKPAPPAEPSVAAREEAARLQQLADRRREFEARLAEAAGLRESSPQAALSKLDAAEALGVADAGRGWPDLLAALHPSLETRRAEARERLRRRQEEEAAAERKAQEAARRAQFTLGWEAGRQSAARRDWKAAEEQLAAALAGLGEVEHPDKAAAEERLRAVRGERQRIAECAAQLKAGARAHAEGDWAAAERAYAAASKVAPDVESAREAARGLEACREARLQQLQRGEPNAARAADEKKAGAEEAVRLQAREPERPAPAIPPQPAAPVQGGPSGPASAPGMEASFGPPKVLGTFAVYANRPCQGIPLDRSGRVLALRADLDKEQYEEALKERRSHLQVKQGTRVRIEATGQWFSGPTGSWVGPDGKRADGMDTLKKFRAFVGPEDSYSIAKLVVFISEKNSVGTGEFQELEKKGWRWGYGGQGLEFVMPVTGTLRFQQNRDGYYDVTQGAVEVTITLSEPVK